MILPLTMSPSLRSSASRDSSKRAAKSLFAVGRPQCIGPCPWSSSKSFVPLARPADICRERPRRRSWSRRLGSAFGAPRPSGARKAGKASAAATVKSMTRGVAPPAAVSPGLAGGPGVPADRPATSRARPPPWADDLSGGCVSISTASSARAQRGHRPGAVPVHRALHLGQHVGVRRPAGRRPRSSTVAAAGPLVGAWRSGRTWPRRRGKPRCPCRAPRPPRRRAAPMRAAGPAGRPAPRAAPTPARPPRRSRACRMSGGDVCAVD